MDLIEIKNISPDVVIIAETEIWPYFAHELKRNNKVLDDISFSIKEGKIVGLLGQNGSGKTTIIKLITGLLTPDEGSILIDGKEVGVSTKAIVSYRETNGLFGRIEDLKKVSGIGNATFEKIKDYVRLRD